MGLLVARTGSDFMSGNNNNILADYEGRVRLASKNIFPDPGLDMFDPATSTHRYLFLEAPPAPTHWAPYMRDKNKVKNSARQVLGPVSLEEHTYDQEDELINGPSPTDPSRTLAISDPIKPDAKTYQVSDTIGLPEGYYCIAWGFIPDRDWNKPNAAMTGPGPRSAPFYLAQGQGFMLPTPTEFAENIVALALWISEPRLPADDSQPALIEATQRARLAPMYAIHRWRVRGINDFVRIVGPFRKSTEEQKELPEKRNLTFIGNKKDMPPLRVRKDGGHSHHDERIVCQVAYAFQTESGMSEVKLGPWTSAERGRTAVVFEPSDYEMRTSNKETSRERKSEIEETGKIDESAETNRDGEDEKTDARGRPKEKEKTDRIRGWRPFVRFKATNDKDNPDDEHGTTEWFMIVDRGSQAAFKERGEQAVVSESEPGKWPQHGKTDLVRVSIEEGDYSGVAAPTESPEPPEGDLILDLNTSGLTPGKHWIKTTLFVVDGLDEQESETSPETEVDVDMGEGIRVKRPKWHNLVDNEDASELDLEDLEKPLSWDFFKPYLSGLRVFNPKRGGVRIEDATNATGITTYFRAPTATLKNDVNRYIMRFNVNMDRHTRGRLSAIVEQYDLVDGIPQLVGAREIRSWSNHVDDKTFEFKLSKSQDDPDNKNVFRMHPDTKEVRVRFEGEGNANIGTRNLDVEISQYGIFSGWGRPRKSKRLDVKRGEGKEPKDTVYPHGGYCMIVEEPENNPFTPLYNTIFQEDFENNLNNWGVGQVGNAYGSRSKDAAIHGEWGYYSRKIIQSGQGKDNIYRNLGFDYTEAVFGVEFFIQTFSQASNNFINMLWTGDTSWNNLAMVGMMSDGRVRAYIGQAAGGGLEATSTRKIAVGDLGRLQVHISGAGTTSGRLRVYLSVGGGRTVTIIDHENINWTGMYFRNIALGGEDWAGGPGLWEFYYDNVFVSDTPSTNVTYEPGNHIEYYGPHGTPKHSAYGPYGVRIPVKGGETYTVALNVRTQDVSNNTSIMRFRARTADHKVLETFDYVVEGISGDTDWTRYTQTFTVPIGTAYIEWFENNIGAGTIWIHGIQLEKGAVATAYTNKNALSGMLSVFFQTAPSGITVIDPMTALAEVSKIRGITTIITDDENTSYFVDFRSGNSLNTLGSYTTLVENLDKSHKYIEVRIQLTSTSDTESPELSRIEIDLSRPHSHLLREDGTEFEGGVLVNTINAEHPLHNVERVSFASGAVGDHVHGTVILSRITMQVMAFRPQTVSEIVRTYGNGFVRLQTPHKRITLRIDEAPSFETNALSRMYLNAARTEFFQTYTMSLTGIVEAEEVF